MDKTRWIEPDVWINNADNAYDMSEFAQNIVIRNAIDTPVATCEITFNPAMTGKLSTTVMHDKIIAYLMKVVKLNSVIPIKIDRKSKDHSFLGRIDHVYESVTQNNNSTSRVIKANCSLFLPKLLTRDNIVNSPILASKEEIRKFLGARTQFFGWSRGATETGSVFAGEPEKAARWILENCVATNTVVKMHNNKKDLVAKSLFAPKDENTLQFNFLEGEYLFDLGLAQFSGPVLNYIMSCIDRSFYEVFFDTATGSDGLPYNTMTIRPKPFSLRDYNNTNTNVTKNWLYFEDVEFIKKTTEDYITRNLGVSDVELKNFFVVNFTNSLVASAQNDLGKLGIQYPIINPRSITEYGIRDLVLTSTLINLGGLKEKYNKEIQNSNLTSVSQEINNELKEGKGVLQYLLEKRQKAVEWHGFPYYESGQVTWIGDEDLKIGKGIEFEKPYVDQESGETISDKTNYYIAGVEHQFAYQQFFKTTTRLNTGAPLGAAAKWLNENEPNFIQVDFEDYIANQKQIKLEKESKLQNTEVNKVEKVE